MFSVKSCRGKSIVYTLDLAQKTRVPVGFELSTD